MRLRRQRAIEMITFTACANWSQLVAFLPAKAAGKTSSLDPSAPRLKAPMNERRSCWLIRHRRVLATTQDIAIKNLEIPVGWTLFV